jgi:hypothetical protein
VVQKLSELIPKQQYEIKIQAVVNSKILARGTLKAVRKDVTAKCYGGDLSRQTKLLKFQAEGKKRMKMVGKVQLSQDVFRKLLSWQVLFSQYMFEPLVLSCSWHQTTKQPILSSPIFPPFFLSLNSWKKIIFIVPKKRKNGGKMAKTRLAFWCFDVKIRIVTMSSNQN